MKSPPECQSGREEPRPCFLGPGNAGICTVFTKKDGTVLYLPAGAEGGTKWLTGDVSGVLLDMTQAQPAKK